jgi:tripartite-type tricarboxylate transporter receptor subunit TctC
MKESGYDAEFYIGCGLFAPAGTPEAVIKTLRNAARQVVVDPQFKAGMAAIDTPVFYLDAPEFQKFWDRDAKRLATLVQKIGRVEEAR